MLRIYNLGLIYYQDELTWSQDERQNLDVDFSYKLFNRLMFEVKNSYTMGTNPEIMEELDIIRARKGFDKNILSVNMKYQIK